MKQISATQNKAWINLAAFNVCVIRSILWFKVIEFPASLVPATNWGFSIQQYSAFKINIMDSNSLNQQIMNVRMSTIPKNVYLLAAPDSYFGKKKCLLKRENIWVTNIWLGEEGSLIVSRKQSSQRLDRARAQCYIVFPLEFTLCFTIGGK